MTENKKEIDPEGIFDGAEREDIIESYYRLSDRGDESYRDACVAENKLELLKLFVDEKVFKKASALIDDAYARGFKKGNREKRERA